MWVVGIVLALLLAFSAGVQVLTDPRITKAFVWRSVLAFVGLFVHVAVFVGAAALMRWHDPRVPMTDAQTIGFVVAFFAWETIGIFACIRVAPRLDEPPRFMMHFGPVDILCWIAVAWGFARLGRLF